MNQIKYRDQDISICEKGEQYVCEWITENPINKSYMIAKLSEYIGNNHCGAWFVKNESEAKTSNGMQCFIIEDKAANQILARRI
jgi:hypothetical protein